MDSDSVIAVIYVGKQKWDSFIIQYDGISVINNNNYKEASEPENLSCGDVLRPKSQDNLSLLINDQSGHKQISTFRIRVTMNGHALSYFVKLLKLLSLYRKLVLQHLKSKKLCPQASESSIIILRISLTDVEQQIIDKIWYVTLAHFYQLDESTMNSHIILCFQE